MLDDLRCELREFIAEREWDQFHSPKNLSMALAAEVGELLAEFAWLTEGESLSPTPEQREAMGEEIADVFLYLLGLCDKLAIDPLEAARHKLEINRRKYPAELARGRRDKYTAYQRAREAAKGVPHE